MQSSKNHNPPHKHSQLTKNKKILLGTLIPFSLLIIALAIFLGCWFGRKPEALVISEKTITENGGKYKITSGTNIYYDSTRSFKLGHDDLNVKAYSEAHGDITDFIIEGTIGFGFIINPTMNFHLMGASGSKVNIGATTNDGSFGIIVGSTDPLKTNNGVYTGIMNIEYNVNINVLTSNGYAVGIYFFGNNGDVSINGKWSVSSDANTGQVFGICFSSDNSAITNINGVWRIGGASSAIGVSIQSAGSGSKQTVNGVWNISTKGTFSSAVGISFNNAYEGILTINGVWNIVSSLNNNSFGVYFGGTSNGTLNINGVWSVSSAVGSSNNTTCGIYFRASNSAITNINGVWCVSDGANAIGVFFGDIGSGTLTINGTQYFSNKSDSGNIWEMLPTWNGSYKWNGKDVKGTTSPPYNDSTPDSSLTTIPLYDTHNSGDSHFSLTVVNNDGKNGDSLNTFNSTLLYSLAIYARSNHCPTIAKQWLHDIVVQIPLK